MKIRTTNTFSESERAAFQQFIDDNNLHDTFENGKLLSDYVVNQLNAELDGETLALAAQNVTGLTYKSPAQIEFERLNLSVSEKAIVGDWLNNQKKLVVDGDPGFENISSLAGWLRARHFAITAQGLNTALTNVINSGQRKLYWKPAPATPAYEGGYGRHSNTKSERISLSGEVVEKIVDNSKEKYYQRAAESIQGRTHAETNELRKIVVTNPDGSVNWKATSQARDKAYEQTSRPARVR